MPLSHITAAAVSREVCSARSTPPELVVALDGHLALSERTLAVLRYLDVALVVLAMAPALVLGAPALGYGIAAGGWILQRGVAEGDRRWIRRVSEPRKQLGFSLFEAFGRTWLLAGVIVIAALVGGRVNGLTAAVVIFGAYTVAFAIRVISGPPQRGAIH